MDREVILIDGITSISESHFSFTFKKKLLKDAPFVVKVKKNQKQDSHFHFNKEDLEKMNKLEFSIFPFHHQKKYTRNEYIQYMKKQFENIIKEDRLTALLECVYDRSLENYQFCWKDSDY